MDFRRAALAALFCLSVVGCQTTGQVHVRYPNGGEATVNFKKGILDDLDIPAHDTQGNPSAYVRVGTSRVAGQVALEGYKLTGEALRRYMAEQAAGASIDQRR